MTPVSQKLKLVALFVILALISYSPMTLVEAAKISLVHPRPIRLDRAVPLLSGNRSYDVATRFVLPPASTCDGLVLDMYLMYEIPLDVIAKKTTTTTMINHTLTMTMWRSRKNESTRIGHGQLPITLNIPPHIIVQQSSYMSSSHSVLYIVPWRWDISSLVTWPLVNTNLENTTFYHVSIGMAQDQFQLPPVDDINIWWQLSHPMASIIFDPSTDDPLNYYVYRKLFEEELPLFDNSSWIVKEDFEESHLDTPFTSVLQPPSGHGQDRLAYGLYANCSGIGPESGRVMVAYPPLPVLTMVQVAVTNATLEPSPMEDILAPSSMNGSNIVSPTTHHHRRLDDNLFGSLSTMEKILVGVAFGVIGMTFFTIVFIIVAKHPSCRRLVKKFDPVYIKNVIRQRNLLHSLYDDEDDEEVQLDENGRPMDVLMDSDETPGDMSEHALYRDKGKHVSISFYFFPVLINFLDNREEEMTIKMTTTTTTSAPLLPVLKSVILTSGTSEDLNKYNEDADMLEELESNRLYKEDQDRRRAMTVAKNAALYYQQDQPITTSLIRHEDHEMRPIPLDSPGRNSKEEDDDEDNDNNDEADDEIVSIGDVHDIPAAATTQSKTKPTLISLPRRGNRQHGRSHSRSSSRNGTND